MNMPKMILAAMSLIKQKQAGAAKEPKAHLDLTGLAGTAGGGRRGRPRKTQTPPPTPVYGTTFGGGRPKVQEDHHPPARRAAGFPSGFAAFLETVRDPDPRSPAAAGGTFRQEMLRRVQLGEDPYAIMIERAGGFEEVLRWGKPEAPPMFPFTDHDGNLRLATLASEEDIAEYKLHRELYDQALRMWLQSNIRRPRTNLHGITMIPHDDNCLFHCFSMKVRDQPDHSGKMRQEIVDYIIESKDAKDARRANIWNSVLTECGGEDGAYGSVDEYCAAMLGSAWGGPPEIMAAALKFQLHIIRRDTTIPAVTHSGARQARFTWFRPDLDEPSWHHEESEILAVLPSDANILCLVYSEDPTPHYDLDLQSDKRFGPLGKEDKVVEESPSSLVSVGGAGAALGATTSMGGGLCGGGDPYSILNGRTRICLCGQCGKDGGGVDGSTAPSGDMTDLLRGFLSKMRAPAAQARGHAFGNARVSRPDLYLDELSEDETKSASGTPPPADSRLGHGWNEMLDKPEIAMEVAVDEASRYFAELQGIKPGQEFLEQTAKKFSNGAHTVQQIRRWVTEQLFPEVDLP